MAINGKMQGVIGNMFNGRYATKLDFPRFRGESVDDDCLELNNSLSWTGFKKGPRFMWCLFILMVVPFIGTRILLRLRERFQSRLSIKRLLGGDLDCWLMMIQWLK